MASTVWRGFLTFGVMSIPIRLFRAARAERLALRQIARVRSEAAAPRTKIVGIDQERSSVRASEDVRDIPESFVAVRQRAVAADTEAPVPISAITRGIQTADRQWVEVAPAELRNLRVETSTDLAIEEFVALAEIDPLYFETSYYVVPEEVGEKAYALLHRTLVDVDVVALGSISMHGRDHVLAVRPGKTGLIAHTLFYEPEVHLDEQFRSDASGLRKEELALAAKLISSLTTTFDASKYANKYQQRLGELIGQKSGGHLNKISAKPLPPAPVEPNLEEALRQSLAQLKKPASQAKPRGAAKSANRSSAGPQ